MSTAAVSLADRRDVVTARSRRPRIRADGNLRALRRPRQRDRVSRLRKQVIRNELVEAFETLLDEIELHDIFLENRFAPDCFQRVAMQLQDRLKTALHLCAGGNLAQRLPG